MKRIFALLIVVCVNLLAVHALAAPPSANRLDLTAGWTIQSSAKVAATGEQISQPGFDARGWYPTRMPSTVVSALVENKVYPDPYFGINLRSYPGMSYPIGHNFSTTAMDPGSPFAVPWWFRTEFRLSQSAEHHCHLCFDSINYRANVWLNGKLIAPADKARGMYRMFEFDVTGIAKPGEVNALAIQIFPPTRSDLSITFVDWNPMPPDREMGLTRDVYLLSSGPVTVRNTQVVTKLAPEEDAADLTTYTDLRNTTDRSIKGVLRVKFHGGTVYSQEVALPPQSDAQIEIKPSDDNGLHVTHPDLWWPYPLGKQTLYALRAEFVVDGKVSDAQDVRFGIREVTSELDSQGHRLFKINGKPILIRGGGWTQDMLLHFSPKREEQELQYARDMHLNAVRLEGKLMNDHFFETCDRMGILVIAGWCCCSYWERWEAWVADDYAIARESERDQIRRLRNHPCLLTWLYGSDGSPNTQAEAIYLQVLKEERWPNPAVSSASSEVTFGAGLTGVKMTGPYNYVAPNYWLQDKERGGAFGFNTETSPGPAIPEIESLAKMLPKEHLWPIDDYWNYHAGGGAFSDVALYTDALEHRYGKATGLEDYVRKSQLMSYEGERAMFEAFGHNKYAATGVIQWMLNNAWPSIIWHLYDYYLTPGGGYFGAKKACELLHVQYSYHDRSVSVVNSWYRAFPGCRVVAEALDADGKVSFSQKKTLDIASDGVATAFTIPQIAAPSGVYFLQLTLQDHTGKPIDSNFYWLSTRDDVSDWAASNWEHTPITTFADFTGLQSLPKAKVTYTVRMEQHGSERRVHVRLKNVSSHLAFDIRLKLRQAAGGQDIEPVLWEDNYFSLRPGETREITATYSEEATTAEHPVVEVEGWNLRGPGAASLESKPRLDQSTR
jgi:exo-1,4-beta-D-glucosaminidase